MEEDKKTFIEQWNEIESRFPWQQVYSSMKALDWAWYLTDGDSGIPSIFTLKKHAKKLLLDIYKEGDGRICTGGFMAGCADGRLYLQFIVAEWCVE